MSKWNTAKHLFAILFSAPMYARLVGDKWAVHQKDFRRDVVVSFGWTVLSVLTASAIALAAGRADMSTQLDCGKVISAVGALVAAWGTWFQLGNVDDTWDRDKRMDPKLRPVLFKVVFFPGLVVALLGMWW